MKAVVSTARGSAANCLSVVTRPKPSVEEGEVLVRIHASGVNPSDVKVRAGAQGPMIAEEVFIHNDGAGVIEEVGSGVSDRRIGERVWLYNVNRSADGMLQGTKGTASEYVSVNETYAVPLPNGVSFEEGACLGVPAMTAHRAVFSGGDVKDKLIFVSGGAGSVGLLAIQVAAASGATIITSVSSEEKAALAEAAGASLIVNYKTQDLVYEVIKRFGENSVDRMIDLDFGGNATASTQILKRNGEIATFGSVTALEPKIPFYSMMFNNTNIQLIFVYAMPDKAKRQSIDDINRLLSAGLLKPHIAKTFSMDNVVQAHELVEAGSATGNVVLRVR